MHNENTRPLIESVLKKLEHFRDIFIWARDLLLAENSISDSTVEKKLQERGLALRCEKQS